MSADVVRGTPAGAGAVETVGLHRSLVDDLMRSGYVTERRIEEAFRAVPRHLFLPGVPLAEVYRDTHIITRKIGGVPASSSSQPGVMAIMLEQLALEPGQRVLEIGAGTGYNAALLAHLAGASGEVVTLDLDEDTAARAREHLDAAGFERVKVVCGDGALGYPIGAPYDRIILTVGAWDILPAWREQLRGRLVLPLTILSRLMLSVAFEPCGSDLCSVSAHYCSFMTLRGAFAHPPEMRPLALGPTPGLELQLDEGGLEASALYAQLRGGYRDIPTSLHLTPLESMAFSLWLRLHRAGWCHLSATGQPAQTEIVPPLFGQPGERCATVGICGRTGLCLWTRPPDQAQCVPFSPTAAPFELYLRLFGADEQLAARMLDQVVAWDGAGRPSVDRLRLRACPKGSSGTPPPDETVIERTWNRLVLSWRGAGPA